MATRGAPQEGRCNPYDAMATTMNTHRGEEHHHDARRQRQHHDPRQPPNPRVRDGIDPSQESPILKSNWIERMDVVDNLLPHHGGDQNGPRRRESPAATSPTTGSRSEEERNELEGERQQGRGLSWARPF